MLIVLDQQHNADGTTYNANSVINVPTDVATWLTGASAARTIVTGPAEWAAGSYAQNSMVSYNGGFYVNNAAAVAGDVPGVAAKWVSVSYLTSSAVVKDFAFIDGSGSLYTRDGSGTLRRVVPEIVGNAVTLAVQD